MISITLASQLALLPLMHGWIECAIAFLMVLASVLIHAGSSEEISPFIYRKVVLNVLPLCAALYLRFFLRRFEFAPLLVISTFYAFIITFNAIRLYKSILLR